MKTERRRLRQRRPPRVHELPAGRPDRTRATRATRSATPASTTRSPPRRPTPQKEVAKKFFGTTVLDDTEIKKWVATGSVPLVKGVDSQFAGGPDADWLKFIYDTVEQREELRAVLGPGAVADPGGDPARQHRQAVPAVGHARPVDRQHEQGHRVMTVDRSPRRQGVDDDGGRRGRQGRHRHVDGPAGTGHVHRASASSRCWACCSSPSPVGTASAISTRPGSASWRSVLADPGAAARALDHVQDHDLHLARSRRRRASSSGCSWRGTSATGSSSPRCSSSRCS